jgi:hypothetical protein
MEQKEQLPPLTPEQLKAEAAYAKEIYQKYNNPTPELERELLKKIERHFRKPKAASAADGTTKTTSSDA